MFLVIVAGGGGYLAWRYHQRTGEIDLDKERWKAVVEDEVDGAKAGVEKAKRVIKDASVKTVAEARDLLGSVEAWLKERDVAPATREELKKADEEYAREFGGETPAGAPAGDAATSGADEATPTGAPADAAAPRAATGEAAEFLARGREEFRKGFEHRRAAGEPGSPREQEELALARDHFTSAQEHLTRAQEGAPDDPEIEKLLVDTNRYLYDCLKRLKVDVSN
ncbi:MAG: hypothetical protein ACYTKD_20215 [Planctomycetota bacterium]